VKRKKNSIKNINSELPSNKGKKDKPENKQRDKHFKRSSRLDEIIIIITYIC
jgi:hypothetical protein